MNRESDASVPGRDIAISLVTVTYNSAEVLREFWGQTIPGDVEWIVVDNASTDDSAAVARSLGARIVVEKEENVGFGRANNEGYRMSAGRVVAFVNPDVTVDLESLRGMADMARTTERLLAPQLLNPDGSPQPNGRGFPTLQNKIASRLGDKSTQDAYHAFAEPGSRRRVAWCIGAAVLASREVYDRLGKGGPWDPRYFVYYEDSDLCLRAWDAGIAVEIIGQARWVHGWARETTKFAWRPWRLEIESLAKFYGRFPYMLTNPWARASRFGRLLGSTGAASTALNSEDGNVP